MEEVTIIIPNYNGMAYMENCLNALRNQTVSDFRIIVVDNGSTDGSVRIVRQNYTEAEIVALDENYGFCRAVNEGIRRAQTPFVILLNNDTEVEEAFVEELLKSVKRTPRIFSCQAKMLNYSRRDEIDDAGDLYCALGWAFARGKGRKASLYQHYANIFACCGGAAIYRKAVFDEIGLFDERHFAYLEDIDVGYRARIFGYENRYVPAALVYHVGSATTGGRYNKFKVKMAARNSIYLAYKNMPLLQLLLNLPLLLAGTVLKQLFFVKKRMGCAYFCGTIQGIAMCRRRYHVPFTWRHLSNYLQIQLDLWKNIWKRAL